MVLGDCSSFCGMVLPDCFSICVYTTTLLRIHRPTQIALFFSYVHEAGFLRLLTVSSEDSVVWCLRLSSVESGVVYVIKLTTQSIIFSKKLALELIRI